MRDQAEAADRAQVASIPNELNSSLNISQASSSSSTQSTRDRLLGSIVCLSGLGDLLQVTPYWTWLVGWVCALTHLWVKLYYSSTFCWLYWPMKASPSIRTRDLVSLQRRLPSTGKGTPWLLTQPEKKLLRTICSPALATKSWRACFPIYNSSPSRSARSFMNRAKRWTTSIFQPPRSSPCFT